MDEKKVNLTGAIPAGILKDYFDSYISILTKILNTSLEKCCFPKKIRLAEVTPVFKKEDSSIKKFIARLVFFPRI